MGNLLNNLLDIFALFDKKTHTYKGKSGHYVKEGPKSRGREGKTIRYNKK